MQESTTRLPDVLDHLTASWRTALEPTGWVVADGPALSVGISELMIVVGVGNSQDEDPYNVIVSEFDFGGRHREDGTVRCQVAAASVDGRDPKPLRDAVLAAFAVIDAGLKTPADAADEMFLGNQRWQHWTSESALLIVACEFDVRWTAWL